MPKAAELVSLICSLTDRASGVTPIVGMTFGFVGTWRRLVHGLMVCLVVLTGTYGLPAHTTDLAGSVGQHAARQALGKGAIVLFRHALAPGVGDPANFNLDDCTTQRNLNDEGRVQAGRIGERLKASGINVGAVWTSQWCRTRETARLMDVGPVRDEPAFNSFFADRSDEPANTARARELLRAWQGPGALVVVTHQVNVSALTGVYLRSGEGVVLQVADPTGGLDAKGFDIVGQLRF